MAEASIPFDPAVVSGGAPIVNHPRGPATSEGDRAADVHDTSKADSKGLLFILDHAGTTYPIPWGQGRNYSRFKSYLEEIYARKGNNEQLERVRDGQFDAQIDVAYEARVVLPSLWTDLVHEGETVRISFWHDQQDYPFITRRRSIYRDPEVRFIDVEVDPVYAKRDEGAENPQSSDEDPSVEDDDGGGDSDESGSGSYMEEISSQRPSVVSEKPVRTAIDPVDEEGKSLSINVDTSWTARHLIMSKENGSSRDTLPKGPLKARDMATETLKITKATTSATDNRTTLGIYTLPGPENSAFSSSIVVRWFHLHGNTLDWTQFKDTCMALPDLSDRTKLLLVKTLHKIEKDYVKTFLGGMFIEPGTVLRGDECNQTDPESVIFSCTPYFEIQKEPQSGAHDDRLYPARTLIQSYYPYEPVRDRDKEQAYRRFGNARDRDLLHVPSLWMLNVCGRAVVTCGYGPISSDFTNSIKVLQEDLKQLGAGSENSITSVRLTDSDGRVLLYSPSECGTYFQIEQRIRELRRFSRSRPSRSQPTLLAQLQGERVTATPANWASIVGQRNVIFIDVSVTEEHPNEASIAPSSADRADALLHGLVPPFYYWPSPLSKEREASSFLPVDVGHSIQCLSLVEKAMLSDTVADYDASGPVDRTFTSTKYYESLSEETFESVETPLLSLISVLDASANQSHRTHHQNIIHAASSKLPGKVRVFLRLVHNTLALFVADVDKSTMLRKMWGAMASMVATAEKLGKHSACDPDPKEYSDPRWKAPKTGTQAWRIRTPRTSHSTAAKLDIPLPSNDTNMGVAIKKCKRCAREIPFDNPNDAIKHLRKHASTEANKQIEKRELASSSFVKDTEQWKDWIRNDDQVLLESTIFGACTILDRAIEEARTILNQLCELAEGVRNDQGELCNLYSFPRKLLETLHRLFVFYFAVERSLNYTEESFNWDQKRRDSNQENRPYTNAGLKVLERFSEGVKSPLMQARLELCEMVRSATPNDALDRMVWGAESISSWLIRRLIVKPLEKSMTVGDMYREYLTTLQFQVNHRPSKRLLRSINLLQEELTILTQVNNWQTQLVKNYMRVLDDTTYPIDIPRRRALYPTERLLLTSCLDNLFLTGEEYSDQISRCGPLSDSTKQSAEINEEDHGKAILVFTVVTVIFLPLSFVTSYLGMNTVDIRDMDRTQSLFWETAVPLTIGIMAVMLAIAYNGDEISDLASSLYRTLAGKQDRRPSARGITVLQRRRPAKGPADSSSTLSATDDAEYAAPRPRPEYYHDTIHYPTSRYGPPPPPRTSKYPRTPRIYLAPTSPARNPFAPPPPKKTTPYSDVTQSALPPPDDIVEVVEEREELRPRRRMGMEGGYRIVERERERGRAGREHVWVTPRERRRMARERRRDGERSYYSDERDRGGYGYR